MQVTVQIHPSWQNDNPAGLFKLLRGLNAIARELEAPTQNLAEMEEEESKLPGRACPGPAVDPAGPGRRLGAADRRADGRGRADGRAAAPGLEQQAGPRRQGADPELRQEERTAVEDRRLEPAAGRGGVPVRPRPAAIYDPLTEPCPPTPRADAFARSAWAWCEKRHLNRWTAGQRRKFEEIWWAEVRAAQPNAETITTPARDRPGRVVRSVSYDTHEDHP